MKKKAPMKDSIITKYQDYDILNGSPNIERHHIFGASNRDKASEDGLWVPLTQENHTEGPMPKCGNRCDVHHCPNMMQLLHMVGQLAYEKKIITEYGLDEETAREKFRERYGESYL